MDITLALGGGGMRGVAHIGVLRVLEREGFRVRAVAGTSIGAAVGAFFAAGFSADQLEQIMVNIDPTRLSGWPFSEGPGIMGMRGIANIMMPHLGERTFADLVLPFAAVAVDLKSRREIILEEGRVVDALLGSMAIPGMFPPRELGPYSLIDGGTLDPVPVRAARALAPVLPVLAVSLLTPLDVPATPITAQYPENNTLVAQFVRLNLPQAFRIFSEAVDIGQRQISEMRLKADAPERAEARRSTFGKVARPRRSAKDFEQALPELRRAVSWQTRLRRSLRL